MMPRMSWNNRSILLALVLLTVGLCTTYLNGFEEIADPAPQQNRSWGPEQAVGKPNTPQAGDIATAWASRTRDDQEEWLLCEYAAPVVAATILVHETYNPGALVRVTTFNEDDEEVELWSGVDPTPATEKKGISEIPVEQRLPIRKIKLYLDSPNVAGWNEIDAVGLEDRNGNTSWASHVEASSTYAEANIKAPELELFPAPIRPGRNWGPEQVVGLPDTHGSGDIVTAWASLTPDGQEEWLTCEYLEPVRVKKVVVHETFNPGAIVEIIGYDDKGREHSLWKGVDPTPRNARRGISKFPLAKPFVTSKIKLIIDSANVPGWNEIDAVAIVDDDDQIYWTNRASASSTYASQPQERMIFQQQIPARLIEVF